MSSDQVRDGVRKSMEPWLKDDVQFYQHQIDGVRKMMVMRNFLLADDMGLGKSLQAITVAAGDVIRGWARKSSSSAQSPSRATGPTSSTSSPAFRT